MAYLEELLPEFRKGAKIRLSSWNKNKFIVIRDKDIVTNDNYDYPLSMSETLSNQWEFYQEPIDWQYIIKNKCLCLFWDEGKERHVRNFLKDVKNCNYKHPLFYDQNGIIWDCCCPVRRDEVTFYEDKEDDI